jgi:hypothetical protein
MNAIIETGLAATFLLMAPMLLHLGALRGAEFYPQKRTGSPLMDAILYRWQKPIIVVNGVLLSLSFLLWKLTFSSFWLIPVILFVPLALLQVAALVTAKIKDVSNR